MIVIYLVAGIFVVQIAAFIIQDVQQDRELKREEQTKAKQYHERTETISG
jgi:hypothetical protein